MAEDKTELILEKISNLDAKIDLKFETISNDIKLLREDYKCHDTTILSLKEDVIVLKLENKELNSKIEKIEKEKEDQKKLVYSGLASAIFSLLVAIFKTFIG